MFGRLSVALGALILIAATLFIVLLLYLFYWNNSAVGSGMFKVYGATGEDVVNITYTSDDTGGQFVNESSVRLPWTKQLTVSHGGRTVQISAISISRTVVTCEIWVANKLVASASDNNTVNCSYNPPQTGGP